MLLRQSLEQIRVAPAVSVTCERVFLRSESPLPHTAARMARGARCRTKNALRGRCRQSYVCVFDHSLVCASGRIVDAVSRQRCTVLETRR